jgi:transglutaminase-like putative cysteine protease
MGHPSIQFLLTGIFLSSISWTAAQARIPDWVRQAAQQTLPKYPEDTNAVELLDEQITKVKNSGEIETTYRHVNNILRPGGRDLGTLVVPFDKETPIQSLKAWTIPADGIEYETKEKEAVEGSLAGSGMLYEDDRNKVLTIPAADPGSILAYEYTQRVRSYIPQIVWDFQSDILVLRARYELDLAPGWRYHEYWANYSALKPQTESSTSVAWDLSNIPAIVDEPAMPDKRAIAGTMVVVLFGPQGTAAADSGSWQSLGRWYAQMASGRREPTPDIRKRASELTESKTALLEKIRAIASFVQHNVRYVGIEVGIGGYQPHPAGEALTNLYGDCKDKATLLSAIHVDSYYVLVNTHRGVVRPNFPTMRFFDHMILAIRLPQGPVPQDLYAMLNDPKLGPLFFFDPTNKEAPFGYIPTYEQANNALLVGPEGGQIVELPLLPPPLNRLIRIAQFQLSPDGTLSGNVMETYWGGLADARRERLLGIPEDQRIRTVETFLTSFLPGLVLRGIKIQNLNNPSEGLVIAYSFLAKGYAQPMGDLLLLHLRVLGEKSMDLTQSTEKKRQYPVELRSTSLESGIIQITLRPGYQVEELPPDEDSRPAFGEYKIHVSVDKNVLQYARKFQINQVLIPAAQIDSLKTFFQRISNDERSFAILRRIPSNSPSAVPPVKPSAQ